MTLLKWVSSLENKHSSFSASAQENAFEGLVWVCHRALTLKADKSCSKEKCLQRLVKCAKLWCCLMIIFEERLVPKIKADVRCAAYSTASMDVNVVSSVAPVRRSGIEFQLSSIFSSTALRSGQDRKCILQRVGSRRNLLLCLQTYCSTVNQPFVNGAPVAHLGHALVELIWSERSSFQEVSSNVVYLKSSTCVSSDGQ